MKQAKYIIVFAALLSAISCKDIIGVEDISNETPVLVAPSDASVLQLDNINFSWETVSFADGYRLQIATPNFTTPQQLIADTLVTTTNFTLPLAPGDYEWKLRAENSAFVSNYAASRSFTISDIAFNTRTVSLISPSNDAATNLADQTLMWQQVPTANNYTIQILDNADNLIKEENLTTTSYNNTFIEGAFQWQVKAAKGQEMTAFSTNQIIIDLTAPSIPAPQQPADDSTTTATSINFSWTRMDAPGSTERDSIFIYSDSSLQNLTTKNESTDKSYTAALDTGMFFWNVKAYDNAGNESDASDTFSFTIE